jgi:hypothetical protein
MINGERRRAEASTYLLEKWGLSYTPATLANMARKGTGPTYRLRGNLAYYPNEGLDAWAEPRVTGLKTKASDEAQAA